MTDLAAYERLRDALERALDAAVATDDRDLIGQVSDLLSDARTAVDTEREAEQPCSDEARSRGCSCRMPGGYDAEPIIDRHCPLHGDPTEERVGLWDDVPSQGRAAE